MIIDTLEVKLDITKYNQGLEDLATILVEYNISDEDSQKIEDLLKSMTTIGDNKNE